MPGSNRPLSREYSYFDAPHTCVRSLLAQSGLILLELNVPKDPVQVMPALTLPSIRHIRSAYPETTWATTTIQGAHRTKEGGLPCAELALAPLPPPDFFQHDISISVSLLVGFHDPFVHLPQTMLSLFNGPCWQLNYLRSTPDNKRRSSLRRTCTCPSSSS